MGTWNLQPISWRFDAWIEWASNNNAHTHMYWYWISCFVVGQCISAISSCSYTSTQCFPIPLIKVSIVLNWQAARYTLMAYNSFFVFIIIIIIRVCALWWSVQVFVFSVRYTLLHIICCWIVCGCVWLWLRYVCDANQLRYDLYVEK